MHDLEVIWGYCIGFLVPENIVFDTKINVICPVVLKIEPFLISVGQLAAILDFLVDM